VGCDLIREAGLAHGRRRGGPGAPGGRAARCPFRIVLSSQKETERVRTVCWMEIPSPYVVAAEAGESEASRLAPFFASRGIASSGESKAGRSERESEEKSLAAGSESNPFDGTVGLAAACRGTRIALHKRHSARDEAPTPRHDKACSHAPAGPISATVASPTRQQCSGTCSNSGVSLP
jgi:hypothetical protein